MHHLIESARAVLEALLNAQRMQQLCFVHGRLTCYAPDNAITFSGGNSLRPAAFTSVFRISHVRPAKG